MIKLIVAYDKNRLIGIGDQLVWDIPEDLEHFKNETLNKTILFGDVTFKGIGRPLPNRKTIILTLDKTFTYEHENVEVCYDMDEIVQKYSKNPDNEILIAGGATIYRIFLPFVDEMIISHIDNEYEGDVHFPEWDESKFEIFHEENKGPFTVKRYKRK